MEVQALKEHIEELPLGCYMILDLHGHSTKRGIFFYGCRYGSWRRFGQASFDAVPTDLGLLAMIAAQENEDVHRRYYRSSMPECKQTTARCTLFNDARARWVYTIEASMHAAETKGLDAEVDQAGGDDDDDEDTNAGARPSLDNRAPKKLEGEDWTLITSARLLDFGRALGVSIFKLSNLERTPHAEEHQHLLAKCRQDAAHLQEDGESGVGSDSCPSDDNIDASEVQAALVPAIAPAPALASPPRKAQVGSSKAATASIPAQTALPAAQWEEAPEPPARQRPRAAAARPRGLPAAPSGPEERPGRSSAAPPPLQGGPAQKAATKGSPGTPTMGRRRPKRRSESRLEQLPPSGVVGCNPDVATISMHGTMDRLYAPPPRDGPALRPGAGATSPGLLRSSSWGPLPMAGLQGCRGGPLGVRDLLPAAGGPLPGANAFSPGTRSPRPSSGRSVKLALRGGSARLHMRSLASLPQAGHAGAGK